MSATDVQETLEMAFRKTGVDQVKIKLRPRLLSDNGPFYLSKELKAYLDDRDIKHIKGAPYHPQTQGKIDEVSPLYQERHHASELLLSRRIEKHHFRFCPVLQ